MKKYEFAVDGISYEDFLALERDIDDETGLSTIDIGIGAGANPVWEDDQFCISGEDEHMLVTYACMCHCALGHEDYFPLMMQLMEMTPAA